MDYITTKEAAEKWNISDRRVKMGNTWLIPKTAEKPTRKI